MGCGILEKNYIFICVSGQMETVQAHLLHLYQLTK